MPYITREDGEHFVIPSYRDVLSAKNNNVLKREIFALSQNYGGYITMQRKGPARFEVAFSHDTGYLLGETVWDHFKCPQDMIYCEAIPNTTEAILVIVKSGSVYLDGSFPIESIPEELVIFLTQENNFEIFTYGDVSISKTPEEGKFSFETSSVKAFTVLDAPVFPTLPLLKKYQFQLVDTVLKSQGIGAFPAKQLLIAVGIIGVGWMLWSYFTAEEVVPPPPPPQVNPYQGYIDVLKSPSPEEQINNFLQRLKELYAIPGWSLKDVSFGGGSLSGSVQSNGASVETLMKWAKENDASVGILASGFTVSMSVSLASRTRSDAIYPLKNVIAKLVDRLAIIYPGNHLALGESANKGVYSQTEVSINLEKVSPLVLRLISEQIKDLPLVLKTITLTVDNGSLSGTITFDALGS